MVQEDLAISPSLRGRNIIYKCHKKSTDGKSKRYQNMWKIWWMKAIYMTKEKEGRVAGVLKEVKFQGLLQNPEDALLEALLISQVAAASWSNVYVGYHFSSESDQSPQISEYFPQNMTTYEHDKSVNLSDNLRFAVLLHWWEEHLKICGFTIHQILVMCQILAHLVKYKLKNPSHSCYRWAPSVSTWNKTLIQD